MPEYAVQMLNGDIIDAPPAKTRAEAADLVAARANQENWPSQTPVATFTYTINGRRSNRQSIPRPKSIERPL